MARSVVDLDGRATILDAAERVAAVPPADDIALVVAPGAPVLRSVVFVEVLRTQAGPRRLSIVTTDGRARSLASAVHVPAYATLAALERRELDPTERLDPARRVVRPAGGATVGPPRLGARRAAAIAGSLAGALLVLAAVLLPEARVVVAATAQPVGLADIVVRGATTAGGADVTLKTLQQAIGAKVTGTATGSRTEDIKAKGSVQLENKTTDDVRVAKGSVFKTADGLQFLTTADATLPRSVIIPPFSLFVGKVSIGVEAAAAGPGGNVASGRITIAPDPLRYTVTNPEPTSGGDSRKIPVVKLEDYDAAVKRVPDALRAAAEDQLAKWTREPRPGEQVVPQVLARQTSLSPAPTDVVGKEVATFDLTVAGIANAYVVPETEPKRTVVSKLRESVTAGNDVDERGVTFDVKSLKVADDGVTWTLTARGQQTRAVNNDRVSRLLTGRRVGDAQSALAGEGLELKRLDWVPGWWPLLPILDARISVQVETPAVRAGP
jgi:hypothetical protein